MDKMILKEVKKYIHQVKKYLICNRKTKKQLAIYITNSINEYYEKNPDCTFEDIKIYFGRPSKLSEKLMSTMDKQEVLSVKRNRLIRLIIILSLIVLIIIVLLILFTHGLSLDTATVYKTIY